MSDRFSDWMAAWNNQNNLFWSRLQTAALIVTGAFTAYYNLEDEEAGLAVLCFSGTLTLLLFWIVVRDIVYLNKIQKRLSTNNDFDPPTGAKFIYSGRLFACLIMAALFIGQFLVANKIIRIKSANCPEKPLHQEGSKSSDNKSNAEPLVIIRGDHHSNNQKQPPSEPEKSANEK